MNQAASHRVVRPFRDRDRTIPVNTILSPDALPPHAQALIAQGFLVSIERPPPVSPPDRAAEQPITPSPPEVTSDAEAATAIDLNTASTELLTDLPHVGEVRAGEIEESRPFQSVKAAIEALPYLEPSRHLLTCSESPTTAGDSAATS